MTLEQLKTYTVGVLRNWFPNKNILNKLGEKDNSLTYDGRSIGSDGGSAPIGTIIAYMGTEPPDGFLICDGAEYKISQYVQLANHIYTQFGSYDYFGELSGITDPETGEISTEQTFKVPDLRGEFLRGAGDNSHENQGSGANPGEHQDATEIAPVGNFQNSVISIDIAPYGWDFKEDSVVSYGAPRMYSDISIHTNSANAGVMTTRPTNTSVLWCIKAFEDNSNPSVKEYSTKERVIGTWIDGRPVYEKTYTDITMNVTNNVGSIVATIADTNKDIDLLIEYSGFYKEDDMESVTLIPYISEQYGRVQVYFYNHQIIINNSAITSGTNKVTLTVRYVKKEVVS